MILSLQLYGSRFFDGKLTPVVATFRTNPVHQLGRPTVLTLGQRRLNGLVMGAALVAAGF